MKTPVKVAKRKRPTAKARHICLACRQPTRTTPPCVDCSGTGKRRPLWGGSTWADCRKCHGSGDAARGRAKRMVATARNDWRRE